MLSRSFDRFLANRDSLLVNPCLSFSYLVLSASRSKPRKSFPPPGSSSGIRSPRLAADNTRCILAVSWHTSVYFPLWHDKVITSWCVFPQSSVKAVTSTCRATSNLDFRNICCAITAMWDPELGIPEILEWILRYLAIPLLLLPFHSYRNEFSRKSPVLLWSPHNWRRSESSDFSGFYGWFPTFFFTRLSNIYGFKIL